MEVGKKRSRKRTRLLLVKQSLVGLVLGHRGETADDIQDMTGCHLFFPRKSDSNKAVEIEITADSESKLERAVEEILKITEAAESYAVYLKEKEEGLFKRKRNLRD